jgi:hypothetical protein
MATPHEQLSALENIKVKLEEARQVARDGGIEPDPSGPDAANPTAPASVVPMIDMAISMAESSIHGLKVRLGIEN